MTAGRTRAWLPAITVVLVLAALLITGVWLSERGPSVALTPHRAPVVTPVEDIDDLPASPEALVLPKHAGSLRFAVLGDAGRGDARQYETARALTRWHEAFDFELVLMLGDNNYGAGTPDEYARRFEQPYGDLLHAGVQFYATLGNHDPPGQTDYAPYNMDGHRYYHFSRTFGAPLPLVRHSVDFFAIDTVNLDEAELEWIANALAESDADWKIAFYHHPLYTSGRYRARAAVTRRRLEPLFVSNGLDVGLSGHEHFYERIVPQFGVQYFTSGGGGTVRIADLRPTPLTAAGFDADTHFLLMELSGDTLYFQAVSRQGRTVDAGDLQQGQPASVRPGGR